jgi:hypothetical protein
MTVCAAPLCAPQQAHAASPVTIAFGTTWDAPSQSLQKIVDAYIGIPGAIHVQTDYMGAHVGDLDPWFWVGRAIPALMITEVAGNANRNDLGWYKETGTKPVIDGIDDGIVFTGLQGAGANVLVTFPAGLTKFGFYMNPNGVLAAQNAPEPELFFTNRFYNDKGPSGSAIHTPYDGDVQALVFDVSQWKGDNTWLVCFEDVDSGAPVTPCCSGTDNDFNDMVFQVTALGATPTQTLTFGQLKTRGGR